MRARGHLNYRANSGCLTLVAIEPSAGSCDYGSGSSRKSWQSLLTQRNGSSKNHHVILPCIGCQRMHLFKLFLYQQRLKSQMLGKNLIDPDWQKNDQLTLTVHDSQITETLSKSLPISSCLPYLGPPKPLWLILVSQSLTQPYDLK